MTTPSRWHKPACDTPQVVVDGGDPECRTCGNNASALLQKAAEEPAPSYSGIKLPPEAPIGEMDLWWPPCVPYTRNSAPRADPRPSSGGAASLAPHASDSSLSEIYTSILGRDHFRLLYLSGSQTIRSPIHGNLVEYQLRNCPEYETTSYTWGGEDGDATPCRPAYFGHFWDVLFITRNCWSLLQYLRPQIGTRTIWVDAICINQNNIQERGTQVSSMPHIYRSCLRVVIYPGDHLIRKKEHEFRRRIRHHDVDKHIDMYSVDAVLQSRYMSRVWIMQELILAPHAILALEHHDLYLGDSLLLRLSRKDGRRRWLEFMGQNQKLRETTLYEGLMKTLDSQATDPRDRIFGILGILGANPTYSKIVPDYSLSMRDCVIGAMGLTLITSNEIWPLLHAQPSDPVSGYPSWVPSLEEIAISGGEAPRRQRRRGSRCEVPGEWATSIGLKGTRYSLLRPGADRMETPILRVASGMPWSQNASIDSGCGALTLQLVRVFDKPHKMVDLADETGDIHFLVEGPSAAVWFSRPKFLQEPEQPCHIFLAFSAQIPDTDPSLDTDPPRLRMYDIYVVFAAEAEASGKFKLVGCCRLDDAVFLSASPPPPPPPQPFSSSSEAISRGKGHSVLSLFETLRQTLNYNTRNHSLPDRQWSFSNFHSWRGDTTLSNVSEAMLFNMIAPGKGATAPGYFQLSLSAARMEEPAAVTKEFRRAYATCLQAISADFNPILDDEYVWFTLVDNDALSHYWESLTKYISDIVSDDVYKRVPAQWRPWNLLFPPWFDLQIPEIGRTLFDGSICNRTKDWEVEEEYDDHGPIHCRLHQDYKPKVHMRLHYWLPCAAEPRELQMPVRARMPLIKVVESIRATKLNWLHRYLVAFSEKVSEDVDALLERGPRLEDSNIYLHDWPKPLVDELGFVWRSELVTFV